MVLCFTYTPVFTVSLVEQSRVKRARANERSIQAVNLRSISFLQSA